MFEVHELVDDNKLDSSVLTFGNFDGLHLGHQKIISLVNKYSVQNKIPSVLLSFTPHTNAIVRKNDNIQILLSNSDKINIIKDLGVSIFCNINFTNDFASLSADEFMMLLINKYNPKFIILGYDNKFGKNGTGNIDYLNNKSLYSKINLIKVSPFKYKNKIVKSTLIKDLIFNNDIFYANKLMSRKYSIRGTVIRGSSIGKKLGFPTANIKNNEKKQIIPKDGVYSVNLIFNSMEFNAVCNIGKTPTLNLQQYTKIEVHVIDQDIDLYNKEVVIVFNYFLRNELKFKNKEDLVNQINIDIESIRKEGELKC